MALAATASARPPTNLSPPTIVSDPPNTAIVGAVLADDGSVWTAPLLSLVIQWEDCDAGGDACTPIPGATAQTYTVRPFDVGETLRVAETGGNNDGSTSAASSPSAVVAQRPQNITPPSISGDPEIGATLTVSPGTWSAGGEPISYRYQWVFCQTLCDEPIAGATGTTYAIPAKDAGYGLAVEVTASDDGGVLSSSLYTQGVAISIPSTPTNTTPPRISGKALVGTTLTAMPGAWSSDPAPAAGPISYSYQWVTCRIVCDVKIAGATSQSFTPTSAYVNKGLAVLVTATDNIGSSQAYSEPVTVLRPSAAQTPHHFASRLAALAKTLTARRAQQSLESAITAPSVGRTSKQLLTKYRRSLTSAQKQLLALNVMVAQPDVRALLREMGRRRRLRPSQSKLLTSVLNAIRRNPAIQLLDREGRALKKHPAALTADIKRIINTPVTLPQSPPSTGNGPFDRAAGRLNRALRSAAASRLAANVKAVLSTPGATKYVESLPPLLVASLIPMTQAASIASAHESTGLVGKVKNELEVTLGIANLAGADITTDVFDYLNDAALESLPEEASVLDILSGVGGVAVAPSFAAVGTVVGVALYGGYQLAGAIGDLFSRLIPAGLVLTPAVGLITAGGSQSYALEEVGAYDSPIRPATGLASLTITPDGACNGATATCTAKIAGPHKVIALFDGVSGSAYLAVKPGSVAKITLSPFSATIGIDGSEQYTVAYYDAFGNFAAPTTADRVALSIGPDGSCDSVALTCTASIPGDHTVTAEAGPAQDFAVLHVLAGTDHLELTPASAQINAGNSQTYAIEDLDAHGDDLGPVTTNVTLTISPEGSCDDTDLTCSASAPGPHVVTAVDRADADATGTASLSVAPASAITMSPSALGGADQGAPYSSTLQATGGQAPYSWAVTSGALPAGVSLGAATGVISGTATTAGPSTFQVTVTDHAGATATATYSLTVYPALMITTSGVGDGAVNQGYTETLQATGGDPPYSWAVTSGSLPTGLSLGASTGVISGTPTTPGTSTFQVTITDQLGGTTSATYELVVPSPPPPVVYVANSGDNAVSAIDPTTNAVTATIPVGSAPDGIAATPDAQFIYVSDSGDGDVSVVSTATDIVVATISVGGEPTGLAVTPNGAYAYVANASAGDVTVISTSTNTVVATVPVGPALSTDPRAVAITPDGAFAYVADGYGDEVAVIDTSTNTAVADVPTNGFTADVAITPDGTVAYATMYNTLNLALGGVETIDTSTDNITDTYGFGDGAYTLVISPDGQSAYVAQLGGQVSILSTAPLSVLANVPTSTGGFGVAVTPDGQSVYASGPGNVVSVISPSTDAVVATIPVGTGPDGVAITP